MVKVFSLLLGIVFLVVAFITAGPFEPTDVLWYPLAFGFIGDAFNAKIL